MIRAEVRAEGMVLAATGLEAGGAYYLDADWLPADGSASIPALAVGAAARDADAMAGAALVDLAERAVAAAGDGAESAVVIGTGTVARHVRRLLAAKGIQAPAEARPGAIVEATGDPRSLADALQQVASLGTIVLVGEPLGRAASLNLYSDLHVRGLTLVGVARPLLASDEEVASLPEAIRAELALVAPGAVLPRDAGWYRLSG
jgi:hypothetical protein